VIADLHSRDISGREAPSLLRALSGIPWTLVYRNNLSVTRLPWSQAHRLQKVWLSEMYIGRLMISFLLSSTESEATLRIEHFFHFVPAVWSRITAMQLSVSSDSMTVAELTIAYILSPILP
jgi:hypothetical protein